MLDCLQGLHGTIACLAIMDLLAINNEMKKHGALETWLLDSLFSGKLLMRFDIKNGRDASA